MNILPSDAGFNMSALTPSQRTHLVRLCARLTGNFDAAEDLAQETLLIAWRNAHRLQDSGQSTRWLSAIARNVCLHWSRQRRRELARCVQVPHSKDAEGWDVVDVDSFASDYDLEVELERAELASLLDQALALLPVETRYVLVKRFVHHSPHAEIAAQLGMSEGAVAVRLHRGKLALRRVLPTILGDDLVAYGVQAIAINDWEETRIWCPVCGQRRLYGYFDASEPSVFALRCPDCCSQPHTYIAHADGLRQVFTGVKEFRPALTRLHQWAQSYYREALVQGMVYCAGCGRGLPARADILPANVKIGVANGR